MLILSLFVDVYLLSHACSGHIIEKVVMLSEVFFSTDPQKSGINMAILNRSTPLQYDRTAFFGFYMSDAN